DLNARIAKQFSRMFGDRKSYTYYAPGAERIAEAVSAPTKNKSHSIETSLDLKGDEQGVIVACGGVNGGYTLFIADHKLHYNYKAKDHFPFTGQIDKVVITLTGEDADQAKEINNTELVD